MKNKILACGSLAIALLGFVSCEKDNESLDNVTIENVQQSSAKALKLNTAIEVAINKFNYNLITFFPGLTEPAGGTDTVSVKGNELVWEQDSFPKRNAESLKENAVKKVVINGSEVSFTLNLIQPETAEATEIVKLGNFVDKVTGKSITTPIESFTIDYRQRHDYVFTVGFSKRRFVGSKKLANF
ncbi:hypothetical protein [Aquimarina agarivorans]|uniref:hypothetical protein n=1 Tax=Aquimarina agarivorans TaxID=980584 RepID=UPI000248E911|nr:hypothetical protein [Aquimarina agarivorans]